MKNIHCRVVLWDFFVFGCCNVSKKLSEFHNFDDTYTLKKSHDVAVRSKNDPERAVDANKIRTFSETCFIHVPDDSKRYF